MKRSWLVIAAVIALLGAGAPQARAAFGIESFTTEFAPGTAGGDPAQAGGHPDLNVGIRLPRRPPASPGTQFINDGNVKRMVVDLPPGFTGDTTDVPHCPVATLQSFSLCPVGSQVGVLSARLQYVDFGPDDVSSAPVFAADRGNDNETARLVSLFSGVLVTISISPRSESDYGLRATVAGLPAGGLSPNLLRLNLWGVPADPSHDEQRIDLFGNPLAPPPGLPSQSPRRAFLTQATQCGAQEPARLTVTSFQDPDIEVRGESSTPPLDVTGCDRVPFRPTLDVTPESRTAAAPAGLGVDLQVPQVPDLSANATAQVRRVEVQLPEGVAASPAAAAGLDGCSDEALGIGSAAPAACPQASKIGDATFEAPALDGPLRGGIYLRRPTPGHLFRLVLVARGSGLRLKIPGEAVPDPVTGRLRAVFDNAPRQPFSRLSLNFDGGSRGILMMPVACGTYTSQSTITSWASDTPVTGSSSFTIDRDCGRESFFSPTFSAGSADPVAGRTTAFTLAFGRPDGQRDLRTLDTTLPAGLLANLKTVPLCGGAQAAAGTCPLGSRIGTAAVSAGSGDRPLALPQSPAGAPTVSLAGPYRGAPFSLSIVVPAQAGPFDLGTVVVRAAIFVDKASARLRVVSDPLPTILQGVPLRIRDVQVKVDRRGFMKNPTNCKPLATTAAIEPVGGRAVGVRSAFQVGECAARAYRPRLGLRLSGRGQTNDGGHPELLAKLKPRSQDANTSRVRVVLPKALALDPDNAQALCEPTAAARDACPRGSVVGRASAVSVLNKPLRGSVYFVRGERRSRAGRVIKTLPKLFIPLRGEGVRIDLNASSAVSGGRLVATFAGLPDVPLTDFGLRLAGGRNGILVVSNTSICKGRQTASASFAGHNGRRFASAIAVSTPCRR